jgi:AraC-like DNA-binding protein
MIGVGRVVLWKGGSAWVGRDTGEAQAHRHHAIQVTLGARPFRIRAADERDWDEACAAIVMPDRPHVFDGCGHAVAMVFIEPETLPGRALLARFGHCDVSLLDDPELAACNTALQEVFQSRGSDAALVDAAQRVVGELAGAHAHVQAAVDARILAVLDRIRDHPAAEIDLAKAAAIAHLSPSRFRHLFVAQTGISFRAYLLWARVGYAVTRGMAGSSWTEAAQQAGFADSAHLSRTCRRMFGIAPSMLLSEPA